MNRMPLPYTEGPFGSCQAPGCTEAPTWNVPTRWHGAYKVACDLHVVDLAVVPMLVPCPCLRGRGGQTMHAQADCGSR